MKTEDFEDDDFKLTVMMFDLVVLCLFWRKLNWHFMFSCFIWTFKQYYVIKKCLKHLPEKFYMPNALEQYSRKNHITPDLQKQESTMFCLLVMCHIADHFH